MRHATIIIHPDLAKTYGPKCFHEVQGWWGPCWTVVGTGVGPCNILNTFGSTLASGQNYNKTRLTFLFNTYFIMIILQMKLLYLKLILSNQIAPLAGHKTYMAPLNFFFFDGCFLK